MQAILMAGGKGTRLRPFTNILPKALVPIGEISILEMVLQQLHRNGFEKIIIAVGHKAELIMAVIGNGSRFGLDIKYHYEDKPLGTIGALADLDGLEDNFLVMNGDICTNMSFGAFYQAHIESSAVGTVGTYRRFEKMELGILTLDEKNWKIIGFQEKPTYEFLVAIGVNAFNKSILEFIPKGEFFGFDDLMAKIIEEDIDVRAFPFNGIWHDIGRVDDYEKMLKEFADNPNAYLPEEGKP